MWDSAEILVVDDVPTNLDLIIDTLSSLVRRVAAVTSGERALKRLQTYIPDLILLDVQMPGLDGFETCQRIKQNPDTTHVPIIFITARTDANSIAKGFELGAVDYISKPFQTVELIARVKTHVQLNQLHRDLDAQVEDRTRQLQQTTDQLQTTVEQLKSSQLQLIQQEKMSSLGNLVTGIAHEINNPLGFIDGNVNELKQSLQELADYITLFEHTTPTLAPAVAEAREQLDIDFLLEDLPKMLDAMSAGCDRIHEISQSLRIFSRAETDSKFKANIHAGLDSTLVILKYRLKANELRPPIQITRNYGELPPIDCFPGQLNQVFMNLLANAIDMFDEMAESSNYAALNANPQTITIRTAVVAKAEAEWIEISIVDNGKGMTPEVCDKIFERNFTTKGVGKGTGIGLAIAQQIIVEKHGGQIRVDSASGQGTQFIIALPLAEQNKIEQNDVKRDEYGQVTVKPMSVPSALPA